jgi:hypothetical protein
MTGRIRIVLVAAAVVMSAEACGSGAPTSTGSGPSEATTSTTAASAAGFSRCMRAHGVADFPDPPAGGRPFGEVDAQQQQILAVERPFASCMRSHGEPTFPDPSISAKGGRPVFDTSDAGIDAQASQTPQFVAKEDICRHQSGGDVPNLPTT